MLGTFNYAPTTRVDFTLKKTGENGLALVFYNTERPEPFESRLILDDAAAAKTEVQNNLMLAAAIDDPEFHETALIIASCYDYAYGNEGAPDARLHAACAATRDLFSENADMSDRISGIRKQITHMFHAI
jgi:hypothetical protein